MIKYLKIFINYFFWDFQTTKLGISECLKHDLLVPYPVLLEKSGDIVAQFKLTAIILQTGTIAITGLPIKTQTYKTENKITDQALIKVLEVYIKK